MGWKGTVRRTALRACRAALLPREYRDEFRPTSPLAFFQGPLLALVAPLAQAFGYGTWYPEYSPSEGRP